MNVKTALARNALDVMLRRGWYARRDGQGWFVDLWGLEDVLPAKWDHLGISDDPFTALVKADRWYRENVEVSPPG